MTDVLADRFAALAQTAPTTDWLDVRRRARRRRRPIALVAALAAAIAAATALAAGGSWVFSTHDRHVTAETRLTVGGRTWHVTVTARTSYRARFCTRATSAGLSARSNCREMGPGSPRLGPPLGALKLVVPGGQIWAGATVGFTRRIAITDSNGRLHFAQAVKAPRGTKTPFRYWAIALDGTTARAITSYGSNGRHIRSSLR